MFGSRVPYLINRVRSISTECCSDDVKRQFTSMYFNSLTFILPWTTVSSGLGGVNMNYELKSSLQESIHNVIAYSTYGFFLGITFPLSFPIISAYTLCLKSQNKNT